MTKKLHNSLNVKRSLECIKLFKALNCKQSPKGLNVWTFAFATFLTNLTCFSVLKCESNIRPRMENILLFKAFRWFNTNLKIRYLTSCDSAAVCDQPKTSQSPNLSEPQYA